MSNRAVRKFFSNTSPLKNNESDDEEFDVSSGKTQPRFPGLPVSSNSASDSELKTEIENEPDIEDEALSSTNPSTGARKKTQIKKAVKKKKKSKKSFEMDEIEQSLMEVNKMLGNPPQPNTSAELATPIVDPLDNLLSVQPKYLDVNNELNRLFGPKEYDEPRGRRPKARRVMRRAFIAPVGDYIFNFARNGLSMSLMKEQDGIKYFRYDHTLEYQKKYKEFLAREKYAGNYLTLPTFEERQKYMQSEVILEYASKCFQIEEYTTANNLLEEVISYMQCMTHSSFRLSDTRVRLEYEYVENRVFHVALLKYLYMTTNKACHRTALEIAKVLLFLDPSDPVAVILVLDTLALRAREHQWLIDIIDQFSDKRDAGLLFNIQYSYAMAHFHVATKNKDDTSQADSLLREAMLRFPSVVNNILQNVGSVSNAKMPTHSLFTTFAKRTTSKELNELINMYAKLTCGKWREPAVLAWLLRNSETLVEMYDVDKEVSKRAKDLSFQRMTLFKTWPIQIVRHLTIIRDMSNLLVDGAVPEIPLQLAANPEPPPDGVDRYGYYPPPPARQGSNGNYNGLLANLLPANLAW